LVFRFLAHNFLSARWAPRFSDFYVGDDRDK
jgi:hypothetical protein